jgi:hypothetical protein
VLDALAHELVVVLRLVLEAIGRRVVLLHWLATRLHCLPVVGLTRECLAVVRLLRVLHRDEDLVAGSGETYSLWTMGRLASPDSMVFMR